MGPMDAVPVTIIAGTGDGGVPLSPGTIGVTADHHPNIVIANVVAPATAILIRFVNLYLTTVLGLMGAALTPAGSHILPAHDFVQLVWTCASLALGTAGLGLGKDCVTILGKLEQKHPLLTGSI